MARRSFVTPLACRSTARRGHVLSGAGRPDESRRGTQECVRHARLLTGFEKRMDLKVYYQKIREVEGRIKMAYPVIVSLETPDGGIAGVRTETPAHLAARMIVEGRARIADNDEMKDFHAQKAEAKRVADQLDAPKGMQVTVVWESELGALKGSKPGAK